MVWLMEWCCVVLCSVVRCIAEVPVGNSKTCDFGVVWYERSMCAPAH